MTPVYALQLCSAVHEHSLEILEGQMMQQDALMSQLAQELDNGRLLRLLSRLVAVSEGSQTSLEPNWSETGQYVYMLFRCIRTLTADAREGEHIQCNQFTASHRQVLHTYLWCCSPCTGIYLLVGDVFAPSLATA